MVMTPTATRLKARLDERRSWFANEWFYKWHFIGKDGPVSIESFDGRSIHYGGIQFSGTVRNVYWDTVVRGVRKEIVEQLTWVDDEVRKYEYDTAIKAIDECAGFLVAFARQIRREAVKKDRILRGNGVDFPPENDAGHWGGTTDAEIMKEATALKDAFPKPKGQDSDQVTEMEKLPATFSDHASHYWHRNQWWLGPIGLLAGIASVALVFF